MDCATLCLISAAVAFTPSSDVQKCNYCLDVRGITPTCNDDIIECAKTYPDMVLYCLTVSSIYFDSHIRRSVRCRSHTAYNASLAWTEEVLELDHCSLTSAKVCNCSTCPFRESYHHNHGIHSSNNYAQPNPYSLSSKGFPKTPNHLNAPSTSNNGNKTFLLTKGMAQNIRGIELVYNKASKPFSTYSFYFFICVLIFAL